MDNTFEKIEEYLESVEDYFFSSLSAATTDLPTIHEAVNRLWVDISRYGPGIPAFPDMHLPSLGDFQVPPPPPPPPPPPHLTWLSRSANWATRHPWTASGIAVSVVGAGLLVGYRAVNTRQRNKYRVKAQGNERRQVIIVLGGDTPLALPLILDLEKKGYIVIASVSTPEAVQVLEQKCEGYVKALVLDPHEPATIPIFPRSLTSTLSRKFPITSAGDPHASLASHPYIHSVICLLTLPTSLPPQNAPFEHISLRNTYLPYLNATHIVPLEVIQALLPLLRTGPARTRDKGKKSIIVCLPAMETRVGIPFSSMQAMSATSTLRGIEVLRREINMAALTGKSESMKNIKVVVVDVGTFNVGSSENPVQPEDIYKAIEKWTPSEKITYGPAFASISYGSHPVSRWSIFTSIFKDGQRYGIARRPTDIRTFVDKLVGIVLGKPQGPYIFGISLGQFRIWNHGERFAIGAGASTYKIASHLPSFILDTLLNVPYFLISIRNRLLPVGPFVLPEPNAPLPPPHTPRASIARSSQLDERAGSPDTNSEADVESNADSVDSGWSNLRDTQDIEISGNN